MPGKPACAVDCYFRVLLKARFLRKMGESEFLQVP